eukprot:764864-Hanusia_phi.AAC.3
MAMCLRRMMMETTTPVASWTSSAARWTFRLGGNVYRQIRRAISVVISLSARTVSLVSFFIMIPGLNMNAGRKEFPAKRRSFHFD